LGLGCIASTERNPQNGADSSAGVAYRRRMLIRPENLTRLGVPAAFSTRVGGVSPPPFDSLNFGNPGELPEGVARDPAANIRANFTRVAAELRCAGRRIVQVHQVHGSAVHVHEAEACDTDSSWERTRSGADPKADAIVTRDRSALIAVRVADCVPIVMASADGAIVSAVHAGWRGVVGGVANVATRAMRESGAREIVAAIGPCIGPEKFEVGPEVVAEFERVFGASGFVREVGGGKALIDLQRFIEVQLRGEGVEDVEVCRRCTVSEREAFFSHRRDRNVTGRMIGIVGARAG